MMLGGRVGLDNKMGWGEVRTSYQMQINAMTPLRKINVATLFQYSDIADNIAVSNFDLRLVGLKNGTTFDKSSTCVSKR